MRVIVVDDDKIIRMGLIKILNKLFEDIEVVSDFQNGLFAFDYLKNNSNKVDLVITDIKMPIMTGVELIEKANKELKNPPIFIVLSGYDEFTYVRDVMKNGAFNYLLKPIKKDELKKVIEEVEIKTDKNLLDNIQLDENNYYQMVVIPMNKEEKDNNNKMLSAYFKAVTKDIKEIEYLYFLYNDNVYIIFYFNAKEIQNIEFIIKEIDDNLNIFIENGISTFILEGTNKVWEIREQSKLVRKVKKWLTIKGQRSIMLKI